MNSNQSSLGYDSNSYPTGKYKSLDTLTEDITKLRPDIFLEGKDAFKKSIKSIDNLLEKYKNGRV